MIHELRQPWSVATPKGKATVYLVMDYGFETDTFFLCVLKETTSFSGSEVLNVEWTTTAQSGAAIGITSPTPRSKQNRLNCLNKSYE